VEWIVTKNNSTPVHYAIHYLRHKDFGVSARIVTCSWSTNGWTSLVIGKQRQRRRRQGQRWQVRAMVQQVSH